MDKTNIVFIILSLFLLNAGLSSQERNIIFRWYHVDTLIRDNKIDKDDAIDSIEKFTPLTVKYCLDNGAIFTKRANWIFPMSDFTSCSYRSNGKDYIDEDFDFFQGAEFKGHPAHDIFILDNDSNSIEDSTGNRVNAVAMVTGVIISTYSRWEIGNFLRSGNYIKLFDPETKAIFYYSHLDSVFVKTGDIVKVRDIIGYVGRTGRKAIHGRTHLHIAYYKINNGYPEPEDILPDLYKAEKKYKQQR